MHLLNETGYNVSKKAFFGMHQQDPGHLWLPDITNVPVKASDKKFEFLPIPKTDEHNKK